MTDYELLALMAATLDGQTRYTFNEHTGEIVRADISSKAIVARARELLEAAGEQCDTDGDLIPREHENEQTA